jgi:hypothetical protein
MSALDHIAPTPRMIELDHADVAATPEATWEAVRHVDLARSPLIRALFSIRTLPERLSGATRGGAQPFSARLDDLESSPQHPGFQILADDPPHEVVVGAIGKVWHLDIPFLHVDDAEAFAAFASPGWVKVAWAIRVTPLGDRDARVRFELRVDATDDESWKKFRRYFRLIGPGSHFIRHAVLAELERDLGTPASREDDRALPGDELLPDAGGQLTHGITIAATPEKIWPWLVQMGCERAGMYSIDLLDNGNERSAREIHPELQRIHVGDVLPATPEGDAGFEVLAKDEPRALILGGLYDVGADEQIAFASPRPARYWQVTWAFVLEPLDATTTRLHVRARGAFPASGRLHASWIRPVHALMETAQLRHLAARAEGRLRRDDARDVLEGLGGAARMAVAFLTPFLREARSHWGLDAETAARRYPGDELVPSPRWSWTHGVEIDAPIEEVWPFLAQLGADRGGFYSYQWLENVAGCGVRNAETVHPEWALHEGDALVLHPRSPPLRIVEVDPGRSIVGYGAPDEASRAAGGPWVEATWTFFLEPLGGGRTRFVSRFRSACSDDVATRLTAGPLLVEPVGFVMDRRMLLGVKERAERRARAPQVAAALAATIRSRHVERGERA